MVRVVSPRCKWYTGHVTAGGTVCLETLTVGTGPGCWQPEFTVGDILVVVLYNFIHCERALVKTATGPGGISGPLRLDLDGAHGLHPLTEYSMDSAIAAMHRLVKNHGKNGWCNPQAHEMDEGSSAESNVTDELCAALGSCHAAESQPKRIPYLDGTISLSNANTHSDDVGQLLQGFSLQLDSMKQTSKQFCSGSAPLLIDQCIPEVDLPQAQNQKHKLKTIELENHDTTGNGGTLKVFPTSFHGGKASSAIAASRAVGSPRIAAYEGSSQPPQAGIIEISSTDVTSFSTGVITACPLQTSFAGAHLNIEGTISLAVDAATENSSNDGVPAISRRKSELNYLCPSESDWVALSPSGASYPIMNCPASTSPCQHPGPPKLFGVQGSLLASPLEVCSGIANATSSSIIDAHSKPSLPSVAYVSPVHPSTLPCYVLQSEPSTFATPRHLVPKNGATNGLPASATFGQLMGAGLPGLNTLASMGSHTSQSGLPDFVPHAQAYVCRCGQTVLGDTLYCPCCGSGLPKQCSLQTAQASFHICTSKSPQGTALMVSARSQTDTAVANIPHCDQSIQATSSPQRIYVCRKQRRTWTLYDKRRAKRMKTGVGGGDTKLLEELYRLEAEISELRRTPIACTIPEHWSTNVPSGNVATYPLDPFKNLSFCRVKGTVFELQQLESQGIPKADAEAALRQVGDGNEAAVYVASIHPAKAAEVEERRFSAPQQAMSPGNWEKWVAFLEHLDKKFSGDLDWVYADFLEIMHQCQEQGGLLRDRESEGFEDVVTRVKELFVDHPEELTAFEEFLPKPREEQLRELRWSDEYERVLQCFEQFQGIARVRVTHVERIQNAKLWRRYALKREEIADDFGGHPNEMWLFHGAHEDVLDSIIEEGFDFRVSRSGSILGHGCYFSITSTYADGYARLPAHSDETQIVEPTDGPKAVSMDEKSLQAGHDEAPDGGLDMLLCRVAVGRCYCPSVAHQYMRRPPQHYHSTAAVVNGSKVYCIYDNAQAYPEYWIRYSTSTQLTS
eukprot:jgi/Botrbrau1/4020/Bobra.0016s0029.2